MKYLDEYRDRARIEQLAAAIHQCSTRPQRLMEVCGGQTHSIVKHGLDTLLPEHISLIHGPGCPVCVTPVEIIDQAVAIAQQPGAMLCSFGDMLRVPGSAGDLFSARAAGGNVRMVYSPMDAVRLAQRHPGREVVFFAVGFETTAPANALAVRQAQALGLENFSLLVSHVLVPPAIEAILSSDDCQINAFLAAGHVCSIMGEAEYRPLVERHRVPIVITGFEPVDILQGIYLCIRQLEAGEARVENQYTRAVRHDGNPDARQLIREVFRVVPRRWRGIGEIPHSGLGLQPAYASFDAGQRFAAHEAGSVDNSECISGEILRGVKKPPQCPAFGNHCTPEHPLGAPMVSTEGACAAYYRYRAQTDGKGAAA